MTSLVEANIALLESFFLFARNQAHVKFARLHLSLLFDFLLVSKHEKLFGQRHLVDVDDLLRRSLLFRLFALLHVCHHSTVRDLGVA